MKAFVDLTRFAATADRTAWRDMIARLEDVGANGVSISDHRVSNEPGMRSCAWMVSGPGGTVSSREATSQVGVVIRRNSASVTTGGPPGSSDSTTPQIGTQTTCSNASGS